MSYSCSNNGAAVTDFQHNGGTVSPPSQSRQGVNKLGCQSPSLVY